MVVATATVPLERAGLRVATAALGATGVFSLVAWLGTISALGLFLINPTAGRGGGGGGAPGGGGPGGGGPGGGGPGGGGPGPGGPGFPGGGRGPTQMLLIGGALLTVFGVAAWAAIVWLVRNYRRPPAPGAPATASAPTIAATRLNVGQEAGKAVLALVGVTLIVFVVAQLVPVNKTNAPVVTQVTWDSPQDQALFTGACADCHSNETVRPWYDYIAPSSWLLASHINGAHSYWDISELNKLSAGDKRFLPNQIAEALHSNTMPPHDYQFMHPAARLTDAQKEELIAALKDVISKN